MLENFTFCLNSVVQNQAVLQRMLDPGWAVEGMELSTEELCPEWGCAYHGAVPTAGLETFHTSCSAGPMVGPTTSSKAMGLSAQQKGELGMLQTRQVLPCALSPAQKLTWGQAQPEVTKATLGVVFRKLPQIPPHLYCFSCCRQGNIPPLQEAAMIFLFYIFSLLISKGDVVPESFARRLFQCAEGVCSH